MNDNAATTTTNHNNYDNNENIKDVHATLGCAKYPRKVVLCAGRASEAGSALNVDTESTTAFGLAGTGT